MAKDCEVSRDNDKGITPVTAKSKQLQHESVESTQPEPINVTYHYSSTSICVHDVLVSALRILYYFIAITLSAMCGYASIKEVDWPAFFECLSIAGISSAFLFFYAFLFELSTVYNFPAYNSIKSVGYLFSGSFYRVTKVFIISTIMFFISTIYLLIGNSSLSLFAYFAIIACTTAPACILYGSRYAFLQNQRVLKGQPIPNKNEPKSFIIFLIMLIITNLLLPFLYKGNNFNSYREDYTLFLLLFGSYPLAFYVPKIWDNRKKNLDKKFIFERSTIKEFIVLFTTIAVPFFSGIYIACYDILNKVDYSIVFRSENWAIMFLIMGVGWVLELLRYLGRYSSSPFHRLNTIDEIGDIFIKSVSKYMTIYAVVISFVPLLFVFAKLSPRLNVLLIPIVLTVYVLAIR